jgi:hypothetical protein
MTATAQYVRDAAAQLDRNAAEQRQASQSGSGGPPGGSAAPTPGSGPPPSVDDEPGSPVLDRLGDLLTGLGVGHDVLELLAEHTALLDGLGVDRLVDILTNHDFVELLKGLDQVLEVGEVVVNLVADFVDNPGLPFDERVVHALADAATRFGIDQGVEYAANFLAQAATTALLPGLGAVLAPFVGQAAGVIADTVIGEIIDVVDGATDFVDIVADAAVEAYRGVKDGFGLVLDAAGAVIDVAADAVDLAGDVAGVVVDLGHASVDVAGDVAGTIGGALNPFD